MKGQALWSHHPYRPLLRDVGDIYICRIVPGENAIHLEWLPTGDEAYCVFCRKQGGAEFLLCGSTSGNEYDITGLTAQTDYAFYVCAGSRKSLVRLARTGSVVGTAVNYLHPEDDAYSFSGKYLASPSLLRHPDGYLLASMDIFVSKGPQNLTLIFRSDDDGQTWHHISELMPCFWGELFLHKGEVYMLSVSTEYGDLLIGRSTDGGKTFSTPVALLRGSNGKGGNSGVHRYPQNITVHSGRIYSTLEWGSWDNQDYCHAAMVMSCDVEDDLLDPESWHFSPPLKYDPSWPGTVNGEARGTIEGTLCETPAGELYSLMRYNIIRGEPPYGLVLAYRVNTADPDAPLEYSHAVEFPCNNSKFMIKFDPVTKRYYSVASRIDCVERRLRRNLLSLMRSKDLEHWEVVCDLIDKRDEDMEKVGFQYCDFSFEGEDLIFLSRTAYNNAHNYHDSNYITFHRVKNFRNL